jgi:hypothetical protein
MEVSGQLHAPATLLPSKSPRYPLNSKLVGLQSQPGHFGDRTLAPACQESKYSSSDVQPIAWSLHHLSYPGFSTKYSIRNISFCFVKHITNSRIFQLKVVEAPRISRQSSHKRGKVVSPKHRSPLPPRKYSWYSFLLRGGVDPRVIGLCQ